MVTKYHKLFLLFAVLITNNLWCPCCATPLIILKLSYLLSRPCTVHRVIIIIISTRSMRGEQANHTYNTISGTICCCCCCCEDWEAVVIPSVVYRDVVTVSKVRVVSSSPISEHETVLHWGANHAFNWAIEAWWVNEHRSDYKDK